MIAVLGGTGTIGRHVAAELTARGLPHRMLRRPDADLRDVDALVAAMDGADQLFLLAPHDPDQDTLEANALHAAVTAGVGRVVKVSGGAPAVGPNGPTATTVAHWRSEQRIEASGLRFAFLRPSFLMQNLATMTPRMGLLPAPMGRGPIAMVDAADVGAAAAAALQDQDAPDRAWHLTGPAGLTFREVAQAMGARYVDVPPRLAARALKRRGASDFEVDHTLRMAAYFATGADGTPTDDVRRLTGRPPRTLHDHLSTRSTRP
jgi:uncharacterized protein YbjT (DUF2867 family)